MRIRQTLLPYLVVVIAVTAVGCTRATETVTSGSDQAAGELVNDSVADDSAPIERAELSPPTTATWDVTLEEHPVLQLLDDHSNSTLIGQAIFVLVDEAGKPVFSGDAAAPQFFVKIDAWYGVKNYIEFTMTAANGTIVDGEAQLNSCGSWLAWLQQTNEGYLRHTSQLPEVKNTNLVWESDGCPPKPEFNTLFVGGLGIDVGDDGFILSSNGGHFEPVAFAKLDSPPPLTVVSPTTTLAAPTTTTLASTKDS